MSPRLGQSKSQSTMLPAIEDSAANGSTRGVSSGLQTFAILIVLEKLNGENYREWAQSMTLTLEGCAKLGFISGESPTPPTFDFKAWKKWKSENALVSSWLINAMIPTIKKSFMFLSTTQAIWEAVREAYSDGENVSQVFKIKQKLSLSIQNGQSLGEYYLEKNSLWQELDLMSDDTWCCPTGTTKSQKN